MDTKLTVRLDQEIIERAKKYAKERNTSLSKIIETYLQLITSSTSTQNKNTALVESLLGVITLPENFDEKQDYKDYIEEKYK